MAGKTAAGGPCDHCGRTSTPCWRKGPPEKSCLCNACGARWLVKHSLDGYMPGGSRPSGGGLDGYAPSGSRPSSGREEQTVQVEDGQSRQRGEAIGRKRKAGARPEPTRKVWPLFEEPTTSALGNSDQFAFGIALSTSTSGEGSDGGDVGSGDQQVFGMFTPQEPGMMGDFCGAATALALLNSSTRSLFAPPTIFPMRAKSRKQRRPQSCV